MTQMKDRTDNFILRLDEAFEAWLKQRLPLVYRSTLWWQQWLNRPGTSTPRSVLLSGLVTLLLLLLLVYWFGR